LTSSVSSSEGAFVTFYESRSRRPKRISARGADGEIVARCTIDWLAKFVPTSLCNFGS
jgi:hypothetical protein